MLTAANGRGLEAAGDMAAVLYWRLPALTPTNPGPLPWLPGIPPTLHDHPVWGAYLAKRSQLVANLADQVQDHPCQGDAEPVWAAPGSHPSTVHLSGNRSVAGRQRHQSPRPPTNRRRGSPTRNAPGPLETTPRPAYRACHRPARQMREPTIDRQHAPHLVAATTTASARTKHPVSVRTGQPHPAANPRRVATQGAAVRTMQSWHAATAADYRIGLYQDQARPTAAMPQVTERQDQSAQLRLARLSLPAHSSIPEFRTRGSRRQYAA